ncbi:MAG: DUF3034 family protein [Gammaproteobacteria bacterium]|nr:DUF3034 family protein [Gammaproteobacteria bacterium]
MRHIESRIRIIVQILKSLSKIVLLVFAGSYCVMAAEPPPLPVHTIEGGGGGAITPIAYLIDAGENSETFTSPSISSTYLYLEDKDLTTTSITSTLFKRLEIGYSFGSLDLGTLPRDIENATTVDIQEDSLIMHTFSARGQLITENQFGKYTPSVVLGVQYKYNDRIDDINNRLGGAISSLGYRDNDGIDFSITATKMFPEVMGRPLIATLGVRMSEASWNGYLGFSDDYKMSAEANLVYLLPHNLFVAYEYRGMPDAYDEIPGLINNETDWHAVDLGWMINDKMTLVGFYGVLGNLVNENKVNTAMAIQFKYEFE